MIKKARVFDRSSKFLVNKGNDLTFLPGMRLRVLPRARRHKEHRLSKVQECECRRTQYRHWHATLPIKKVNVNIDKRDIAIAMQRCLQKMVSVNINKSHITISINVAYKKW